MLDPVEQKKIDTVIRTHWFIFFSFVTAIVLYTVILLMVTEGTSIEPREMGLLRNILIAASLAAAAAKFLIQTRSFSDENAYVSRTNIDQIIQKYTSTFFVMLALAEVPALSGLVITFITMRMEEWWIFFGISLLLLVTSAPKRDRLERIAQAHASRFGAS